MLSEENQSYSSNSLGNYEVKGKVPSPAFDPILRELNFPSNWEPLPSGPPLPRPRNLHVVSAVSPPHPWWETLSGAQEEVKMVSVPCDMLSECLEFIPSENSSAVIHCEPTRRWGTEEGWRLAVIFGGFIVFRYMCVPEFYPIVEHLLYCQMLNFYKQHQIRENGNDVSQEHSTI